MRKQRYMVVAFALFGLIAAVTPISAVVLQLDEFTTDTENWATRDGELTVSQNGFSGGVLSGVFGAANPGDVITDAFRLTTIPLFPGYILTALSFDFYSADVLPSDLVFRIGNGATTFFRSLALGSVGGWSTYSLALDNQSGWLGGAPSAFTSVLESATFYDIQLTQNGTAGQTFYVDNFQWNGEEPGYNGGGGSSAVPEPGTISLMAMVMVVLMVMRRRHRMLGGFTALVGFAAVVSFTTIHADAESFDVDTSGWVASETGSMNISHHTGGNPAGSLAGVFSTQQNAYPQSGSFMGPPSFVADQFSAARDLRSCLLGFDFKAGMTNPAAFKVRIGDGSSRQISRFLSSMIDDIDRWYSFRLSLASPESGLWDGDVEHFDDIMNDVQYFSIDISRNGEMSQGYQIDNVFVDGLPDAGDAGGGGEQTSIRWNNLRTGEVYRVEASMSLNPAVWSVIETFTASSDVHITEFISTNEFRFFRIVLPWL